MPQEPLKRFQLHYCFFWEQPGQHQAGALGGKVRHHGDWVQLHSKIRDALFPTESHCWVWSSKWVNAMDWAALNRLAVPEREATEWLLTDKRWEPQERSESERFALTFLPVFCKEAGGVIEGSSFSDTLWACGEVHRGCELAVITFYAGRVHAFTPGEMEKCYVFWKFGCRSVAGQWQASGKVLCSNGAPWLSTEEKHFPSYLGGPCQDHFTAALGWVGWLPTVGSMQPLCQRKGLWLPHHVCKHSHLQELLGKVPASDGKQACQENKLCRCHAYQPGSGIGGILGPLGGHKRIIGLCAKLNHLPGEEPPLWSLACTYTWYCLYVVIACRVETASCTAV